MFTLHVPNTKALIIIKSMYKAHKYATRVTCCVHFLHILPCNLEMVSLTCLKLC